MFWLFWFYLRRRCRLAGIRRWFVGFTQPGLLGADMVNYAVNAVFLSDDFAVKLFRQGHEACDFIIQHAAGRDTCTFADNTGNYLLIYV
jgi:hypothetical protein